MPHAWRPGAACCAVGTRCALSSNVLYVQSHGTLQSPLLMPDAALAIWCNLQHLMKPAKHQAQLHLWPGSVQPPPLAYPSSTTHIYVHPTHARLAASLAKCWGSLRCCTCTVDGTWPRPGAATGRIYVCSCALPVPLPTSTRAACLQVCRSPGLVAQHLNSIICRQVQEQAGRADVCQAREQSCTGRSHWMRM